MRGNFMTNALNNWIVTCVRKPHRESKVEHITHIGIRLINIADMSPIFVTVEEAIARLELAEDILWSGPTSGPRAQVIIISRNGGKYLSTIRDGLETDNLLKMPECSELKCLIATAMRPFNWPKT